MEFLLGAVFGGLVVWFREPILEVLVAFWIAGENAFKKDKE